MPMLLFWAPGSGAILKAPPPQAPPPPANYSTAPPPATQQQSGGLFSGLGRTMAEGVAWGTGTAVAREAVGSIFGGRSHHSEAQPATQQAPPAGAMQGPPKVSNHGKRKRNSHAMSVAIPELRHHKSSMEITRPERN